MRLTVVNGRVVGTGDDIREKILLHNPNLVVGSARLTRPLFLENVYLYHTPPHSSTHSPNPAQSHNYHSLSFASCGEISVDSATTFHPSTHHHHHLTVVPIAFLALRGNYSIRARISGLTERLDGPK